MSKFICYIAVALTFLCGMSFASDSKSPFIIENDSADVFDLADKRDLYELDSLDAADVADAEDDNDELFQDTPDTDEVFPQSDTTSVAEKEPEIKETRKDKYHGIHTEMNYVTADLSEKYAFHGFDFSTGYAYEFFVYSLTKHYALAFVTGANVGVIAGAQKHDIEYQYISEPYLETNVKAYIGLPFTLESMIDLYIWSFIYDVGIETNIFLWEYKSGSNMIHEYTDHSPCFKPAFYVVFGAGDSFNIRGTRLEYVVRTTHSLFGYHIGKKREVRVGVNVNLWL